MRLAWIFFAAASVALAACGARSPLPAISPSAAPSPGEASCTQRARALGFIVQSVDPAYRDAYGDTVVPLLVAWGNTGVHIDCRIAPGGEVAID